MTIVNCKILECLNNTGKGICKLGILIVRREKWDEVPVETCQDAAYNLGFIDKEKG